MNIKMLGLRSLLPVLGAAMLITASSSGATIKRVSVFASGTAIKATGPDAITVTDDSVWVSYSNSADSTGLKGNSTVVQYNSHGQVEKTYSIPGSVDGLKVNPGTGIIWALQNQDGNSTLTLIDPKKGILPGSPLSYAQQSATRGYDDVAFLNGKTYMSYTNPTGPEDDTIRILDNHMSPLRLNSILEQDATGYNLVTKQQEKTSQNDPDSLSTTPFGGLMLSSDADGQLIFVNAPNTPEKFVSFLQLVDKTGTHITVDDSVWALTPKGTFLLSDTKNNRVLKIEASDIAPASLFVSSGSLNALGSVDLETGVVTPFYSALNAPHGMVFISDFRSLFDK